MEENNVEQTQQPLTGKALWEQNVRAKYGNELSEDELYNKIGADFDAEKSYASGARVERERLQQAALADPDIAKFIQTVGNGGSVSEAAKNIPEDLPETDKMAYANMEAEASRRAEAAEQSMNKLNDNLNQSKVAIEEFLNENNISKEEGNELINQFMEQVAKPISEGLLTKEALQIVAKGLCYDKHKVQWEEAGRAAGRNDKIEEDAEKFKKGIDGLPNAEVQTGVKNESSDGTDNGWLDAVIANSRPHPMFG